MSDRKIGRREFLRRTSVGGMACLTAPGQLWGDETSAGPVDLRTQVNRVVEWTCRSDCAYEDPFNQVEIDAVIQGPGDTSQRVPGFWAGGNEWRFRFSAARAGDYRLRTESSDASNPGLHGGEGTIRVEPYRGENELYRRGPIRISRQGKHFEHADGAPFFWLADSWWLGMCKRFRWPNDFKRLTQDRREKGFTVIQFPVGFACDMRPFDERGANEAGFPLTENYQSINPAYFDLIDRRVEWLVEQGLVPAMMASWGYYLPFMGVEKMKACWRYVVARYGAYPVVWNLAGESTLIWYLTEPGEEDRIRKEQVDGWSEVGCYLKRIDPFRRLITVHPGPGSGGFRPITDMSSIDFVMVQPGHSGYATLAPAVAHVKKAMAMYPDKPVLHGEVCFEGMHGGDSGPKIQRFLFWSSVLSGAAGYSYGADGIWQFNTREKPFGPSPGGYIWGNAPWEEAHQWLGSRHVGVGRRILEHYPWHRFEPHPEWVKPAANSEDCMQAYAAGIPRKIRMIYFPIRLPWSAPSVIKCLEPGVPYEAAFIDPITAEEHRIGPVTAIDGQWEVPKAPILQDWLLALKATE